MKIGPLMLENNIFPNLAGVTDLPFRVLCKEQGCGFVYTEMISIGHATMTKPGGWLSSAGDCRQHTDIGSGPDIHACC